MQRVDVWVLRFDAPDSPALIEGLMRVFKLEEGKARTLIHSTPRIVKRNVEPEVGERFRGALMALGAKVELRPARVSSSPGVSPTPPRPSDPVPAGPPMSLPPVPFGEEVVFESPRPPAPPAGFDQEGPAQWLSSPAEDAASGGAGVSAGDFEPAVTVPVQRVSRHSLPPGSIPDSSPPPRYSKGPPRELEGGFERSVPALGALVAGLVVLGVGLALDRSSFRGSAGTAALFFDAIGLVGVSMGLAKLVRVHAFDGDPHLDLRLPGVLLLPFVLVAYLVNGFVGDLRDAPPATVEELNAQLEESFEHGLSAGQVLEDRSVGFPGFDRAEVEELVGEIERVGGIVRFGRPVERESGRTCDTLFVLLPEAPGAREDIERAYHRFLGLRRHELPPEEITFDPGQTYAELIVGWGE